MSAATEDEINSHRIPILPTPGTPVTTGPIGSAPYHPPIDLDPRVIENIDGFGEFQNDLTLAQNSFSIAFEGLKAVAHAREMVSKNPADNDYQRLLKVSGAAEKAYEQMNKKFDAAHNHYSALAKSLDESLSTPLEQKASTLGVNPEIRAHVKAMKNETRIKFLEDALERGDSKTLTAVLGAPSYLSGLTEQMLQTYTRRYHEQQSPQAAQRLRVAREALRLIRARSQLVHEHIQKAMGGTWDTVKKLRTAGSEAEKALLMQKADAA